MPVKVKCRGCEKVLNVPDKARGKSVRCPNCETVLKIPAGQSASSGQRKKPSAARPKQRAAVPRDDDDDFLGGVDLRRAVDRHVRVCIKCGAEAPEVDEDEEELVDCPECGHNIDTGVMSEYIRKKRTRRGPDPEEFWGVIWTEPWQFLKKNIKLVLRTAGYWSFFQAFQIICFRYAQISTQWPIVVFWAGLGILSTFGVGGWIWLTTVRTIRHTMSPKRNKKLEGTHFDMYQCFSLGFKSVFWQMVVALPIFFGVTIFYVIPLAFSGAMFDSAIPGVIAYLVVVLFCVSMYPVAMVHMSMPYTYKAWLPVNLVMITAKNIVPVMGCLLVFLAMSAPVFLILLIFQFAYPGGLSGIGLDLVGIVWESCADLAAEAVVAIGLSVGGWFYLLVLGITLWVIVYLAIAAAVFPTCLLLSFPLVYAMRVNGLFALYFNKQLELVSEQKPNVLCGFGPRYLAFLVDILVLGCFLGTLFVIAFFGGVGLIMIGMEYLAALLLWAWYISCLIIPWLYFARPESASSIKASIGKHSLGIIVTKEDGSTMSFGEASGRYFAKEYLSRLLFGAGFLMCLFNEKQQTLHDLMVKTIVVWKGDDERKLYE